MEENAIPMRVVYYLATLRIPNRQSRNISGEVGLFGVKERGRWHRIVVEKPFGTSLETAKELDQSLLQVFCEQEIYRIDHFLGKETVQNILVLRFANEIFESLVEPELRGLRGDIRFGIARDREPGKYYETTGALRDMVQNHLMQLLAFVAMESPATMEPEVIRDETVRCYVHFANGKGGYPS